MRQNLPEHLANERTFLAWLRTSIAIIAFGFVVERFSLFLKYFNPGAGSATVNPRATMIGLALIWLGTLLIPVSLWRFLLEQRAIDRLTLKQTGNWPIVALAVVLAAAGVYLALTLGP